MTEKLQDRRFAPRLHRPRVGGGQKPRLFPLYSHSVTRPLTRGRWCELWVILRALPWANTFSPFGAGTCLKQKVDYVLSGYAANGW
jgi:hypothetical protein